MSDDNRENKTTIKEIVLSEYEKDDIFMVRWVTLIISTIIVLSIWIIFFHLSGELAIIIFSINAIIPPLYYFRKSIYEYIKEKIIYWWTVIRGKRYYVK